MFYSYQTCVTIMSVSFFIDICMLRINSLNKIMPSLYIKYNKQTRRKK